MINKLRRWIIQKLGGFVADGIVVKGEIPGYWDKVPISRSIYVSPSHYTKDFADSIEQELASQIACELLRKNCIYFATPYRDHDELCIHATCSALTIHDGKSYHMPNHLVFKEDIENVKVQQSSSSHQI